MGIDVRVESEEGEAEAELGDPNGLTERLLPALDDASSPCLRFIDPYGITTVNQRQLPFFIEELSRVLEGALTQQSAAHGREILKLAHRANAEVHTYLRFYGD